ncbi:MAG: carboxypeptidase regulatory-like domain-containing protein [Gemmatimonadales bacterium]
MIRTLSRHALTLLAGLAVVTAELAAAQVGTSTIRGVLKIGSSGKAISGARVSLIGTTLATETSELGAFEFPDLVPGRYVVRVSAIGYATIAAPVDLKVRQTMELEFITEPEAVVLPEVEVTETATHGPADWNRRRTEGRGRYITRRDIEQRRPATVPDMMRMVPGVRVECRTPSVCRVRMARSSRCDPAFFMDGIPSDPAIAYLTPINEVEGIEVYSGPAETPPELESYQARCGVVVIWTRTPPPRRLKTTKPVVDTVLSPPIDTVRQIGGTPG